MKKHVAERGFVALISAVIITAIIIPLAIGASTDGLFARLDGLGIYHQLQARILAQSCIRIALLALATSSSPASYTVHGEAVALDDTNHCTIAAITHAGTDATIDAYASDDNSFASVSANIALLPYITVLSWDVVP